jgi:hypothetical protein
MKDPRLHNNAALAQRGVAQPDGKVRCTADFREDTSTSAKKAVVGKLNLANIHVALSDHSAFLESPEYSKRTDRMGRALCNWR